MIQKNGSLTSKVYDVGNSLNSEKIGIVVGQKPYDPHTIHLSGAQRGTSVLTPPKQKSNLLVLVDFDGTITQKDVGALLFNTFSKKQSKKIVSLWLKGKISSKECLKKECELIKITKLQFKKYAISQEMDEQFPALVDLCNEKKIKLTILSDELDFYIKLILKKYGLEEVSFYSNIARFDNGKLSPEFPYFDKGCGNCGNCKKYHLRNLKGVNQKVVYIGDGLSDKCAVQEADLIFAKNDLHKFCVKEKVKHYPFRDFGDIIQIIQKSVLNLSPLIPLSLLRRGGQEGVRLRR